MQCFLSLIWVFETHKRTESRSIHSHVLDTGGAKLLLAAFMMISAEATLASLRWWCLLFPPTYGVLLGPQRIQTWRFRVFQRLGPQRAALQLSAFHSWAVTSTWLKSWSWLGLPAISKCVKRCMQKLNGWTVSFVFCLDHCQFLMCCQTYVQCCECGILYNEADRNEIVCTDYVLVLDFFTCTINWFGSFAPSANQLSNRHTHTGRKKYLNNNLAVPTDQIMRFEQQQPILHISDHMQLQSSLEIWWFG